ncbi:MAG: C40 family peptidase [Clostridia bacterium]|nr:C40 family peptidase [Clostridia bacterium]
MIKLIITYNKQQFDISDYIESVKWSGRKGSPSRQINVTLKDDVRYWISIGLEWEILKGLRCEFYWKNTVLFKGLITDTTQSKSRVMSFTAYDYGIYLSNSSNTFTYKKKTLSEIVIDCCQRAGVKYDVITKSDYKVPDITKPNAKYWDVIQSAMQATKRKTGKTYFIQFSDNACHLFERRDMLLQWVLATDENITDYSYTNSIQQTKTRIKLIDSKQNVVATKIDNELEAAIGTFQDVQQPDDGNSKKEFEQCAERLLNAEKIPQRSLSISAYGITEAISGYCVYVMIDRLNWGRSFFIDEDNHTFKGNTHTMQIKINLCGDSISDDVSAIMEDYKKEDGTGKGNSKVVSYAKKLIGCPYVFGASGPKAFDCSGLVCYVFQHTTKPSLARTDAQHLYGMCKKVTSPVAGDLVFFTSTYKTSNYITHVGIYAGNGKMIAAQGTKVQEATVASGGTFVGYGRLE